MLANKPLARLAFLLIFVFPAACGEGAGPVRSVDKQGRVSYKSGKTKRTNLSLPDGTSVLMNAASVIRLAPGFDSTNRDVYVEGEIFFTVASGGARPFVVHTRALVTTVTDTTGDGQARFKVNGFPESPGEEVDVLTGRLKVIKSYHSSTDNAPETIGTGEMVMVNTDIDLMEKEVFKTEELKAWIDGKDEKP